MKRKRFLAAAGSTVAVGTMLATDSCSPGGSALNGAVPLTNGATLTVEYATTDIAGYRLRTRTYNGRTYGPTIEARPGETLGIRVVNGLPPNPAATVPAHAVAVPRYRSEMEAMASGGRAPLRRASGTIDPENNPHGFNTTNLHVHGVQTVPHMFDPIGTEDPAAMMLEIEPGQSFAYNFPIPHDHPAGLYWYHPHKHGATDVQVSGGMAGLLVIRGAIDEIPEIAAARELFLVVQTLDVNPSKRNPGTYEREYVAYRSAEDGGYSEVTDYTLMTVNGHGVAWVDNTTGGNTPLGTPGYDMKPGEVVRVRLLNGTGYLGLALALPGFEAWQIGYDGINLPAPLAKDMSGTGVTTVERDNLYSAPIQFASPANRIELLLRAPQKPGTYVLSTLATVGLSARPKPPTKTDLIRFVVSGTPVTMEIPKRLPIPAREYPHIADDEIVARRTFTFQFEPSTRILTGFEFPISGELYKMEVCPTTVRTGTCEEWRIESSDSVDSHPFHLHTNSFEVVAINDEPLAVPQIWDTFLVQQRADGKNGSITIRIRFKQWSGKDVFHCHILTHEDTGMMRNFLMTGHGAFARR